MTINLNAGSFSSTGVTQPSNPVSELGGRPYNNISIAYGTVIHHAIGSGSGNTTFQSVGTGNYSFTGLGTNNTLDYSVDTNAVGINLVTHTVRKNFHQASMNQTGNEVTLVHWEDKFTNIQHFIGNSSTSEAIHFSGASNQYSIVNNADGSVTVTDTVAGRDGTVDLNNIGTLVFTDGIIRI